MTLTREGRRKLSSLAKKRDRNKFGQFLPVGWKNVYDMSYIRAGATRKTPVHQKWVHARITQYSTKPVSLFQLRRSADHSKPFDAAIPSGNREQFEAFMWPHHSKKQAKLEGIDDEEPHIEVYSGKGGGLKNT